MILSHTIERCVDNFIQIIEKPNPLRNMLSGKHSVHLQHEDEYLLADSGLNGIMRLITGLCVDQSPLQQSMFSSSKSIILLKLCQLPVKYISQEAYKRHLFPCIIALCLNNLSNYTLYKKEMAASLISTYMQHALDSLASVGGPAPDEVEVEELPDVKGLGEESTSSEKQAMLMECVSLSQSIPVCLWKPVIEFFAAV